MHFPCINSATSKMHLRQFIPVYEYTKCCKLTSVLSKPCEGKLVDVKDDDVRGDINRDGCVVILKT